MNRRTNNSLKTRGFTLVELMVSIFIVSIIATFILVALNDVRERARERRAETQVARIHQILMARLDEYRVRSVPVRSLPTTNPNLVAEARLLVLRDLMRLEMPDRKTDVTDPPVNLPNPMNGMNRLVASPPALYRSYQRRAMRSTGAASVADLQTENFWTSEHQGSECLYMVLSAIQEGETNAVEFFKASEVGDTDGDGMLEILDPWERPIEYLRWAPGVLSPIQDQDRTVAADPFDAVKKDRRWSDAASPIPFALYPFVVSSGPDEQFGLVLDDPDTGEFLRYSQTASGGPYPNDPYTEISAGGTPVRLGQIFPAGNGQWGDNIHNHATEDN